MAVYGPYAPSKNRTRWRLQVYDERTRRKKSLTAASFEEAQALIPFLQAELKKASPLRVHQAIVMYLEHKSAVAGAGWIATLGIRLRSLLPDDPLPSITPARAESIYLAETRRVGKFGQIKPATHHLLLRSTKEFFAWLVKRGHLKENPFAEVAPIGRPRVGKEQPRETDALKLDRLLFGKARNGDEGALALLVQMYLGLRSSEVLALLVKSVEREGRKISIAKGKTENARRVLELYPEVAELLWAHCQGRPIEQRVFAANLPKQPAANWMLKRLHRFCTEAGIGKFCPHSLRGLHATLALTSGATTYQVAASLGHASFATTRKHYADPSALANQTSRKVASILKPESDFLGLKLDQLSEADRQHLLALLLNRSA